MDKRTPRVPVTLTDEEKREIAQAMRREGVPSLATFLRMAALKWARDLNG